MVRAFLCGWLWVSSVGLAAPADSQVSEALSQAFAGSEVPGAVGAVLHVGKPPRIGSYGVAKYGGEQAMSPDAVVHLGSDTKAMTAVLIARLVEKGTLRWTTTVAEGLPALTESLHPDYHKVTLLDLLRHTARMPANAEDWWAHPEQPMHARRLAIIAASLGKGAAGKKGRMLYSNLGYVVAGAIAEEATGTTWEELMQAEVFGPLAMTSAGFGVPPEEHGGWGHVVQKAPVAVRKDNAPALGPAGTAHMNVSDWARFLMEFTASGATPGFLSEASRAQLVEVGVDGYACGWMVGSRSWAGGTVLTHSGSNTSWFAVVWLAPAQDRGFVVVANAGGPQVPQTVDQAVAALIGME